MLCRIIVIAVSFSLSVFAVPFPVNGGAEVQLTSTKAVRRDGGLSPDDEVWKQKEFDVSTSVLELANLC
jgi:hypothetical protein